MKMETGNYLIVEYSSKDSFQSWGEDRQGQNNLGKLWMKLRKELKKQLIRVINIKEYIENATGIKKRNVGCFQCL